MSVSQTAPPQGTATPEDILARIERLRETVMSNDIVRWITSQLQDLRELIG